MIATLALTLAMFAQLAAPVEPLGPPTPGWTTPKDGRSGAGWYMVRKDAAGNYHVFAKDQPSGRFEPYSIVRPPLNYGVDVNHRHPLQPATGEMRGNDLDVQRELAKTVFSVAPHRHPEAGPCPGPGPCPSPRRPEPKPLPKPLPKPGPVVPELNLVILGIAGVLVLGTGLAGLGLIVVIVLIRNRATL